MWLPLIRFAAAFIVAALFVKADAFAQLTKLNVGYVGVTSDNAALALSDKQLLERTYEGAIAEHKLPAKQYPTLEGLKTIPSDPKAKGAKAEDFVDLRFIKELDESGYIDKLYKR